MLLAGCVDGPTAAPSGGVAPTSAPSGAPSAPPTTDAPSPSAAVGTTFPLAVVTGLTNLKATVTLDQLVELAADGDLLAPCGVHVDEPAMEITTACIPAEDMSGTIRSNPDAVALLPPGLVEPATKVLPIAGDGPYGLFGPDLFGDPEARALPYPVRGTTTDETLDLSWTEHDPAQVWTMTSIGSLCSDRAAAEQAVTRGKGWDWVFGGGTARYRTPPSLNPESAARHRPEPLRAARADG